MKYRANFQCHSIKICPSFQIFTTSISGYHELIQRNKGKLFTHSGEDSEHHLGKVHTLWRLLGHASLKSLIWQTLAYGRFFSKYKHSLQKAREAPEIKKVNKVSNWKSCSSRKSQGRLGQETELLGCGEISVTACNLWKEIEDRNFHRCWLGLLIHAFLLWVIPEPVIIPSPILLLVTTVETISSSIFFVQSITLVIIGPLVFGGRRVHFLSAGKIFPSPILISSSLVL